ncbi:hypothetical protein G9A89_005730 [Geosiphon pyriformis]|nr:hypothetical protein G9A89_005730 [Geosiphon pyriformis]
MAYTLIAKLDNFTGEEDNAQMEFLRYFSNNNSINKLANLFTTIKQGDTEAVTTYLGCFHRNLCQIQAIQADYFTAPQILNQFIRVTHARDFKAAELKANHTQAVNLVMNGSSELDSKLKQFTMMTSGNPRPRIAQNWRSAIVVHQPISSSSHQSSRPHSRTSDTSVTQNPNSQNYLSLLVTPENATPNNQKLEQTPTNNIPPATIMEDKSLDAIFPFKFEGPLTTPLFSKATLEEKPITTMYTDAKIDGHLIKLILDSVDRAASARIITADGAIKTPIGKIDDLPIEINGIIVPIKVLIMKATQYQALVGNDWLSKTNATLDWNTQKLQLSQNRQHMHVPAMSYQVSWADKEHNKLLPILSWDDDRKKKQTNKLIWKTDDLTWTDNEQEEASSWEWKEDKGKGKEKEEVMPPTITIYNSYTHHTPQQSNYQ